MMTPLILVALGGAVGSVLRYLTGLAVAFPFGTLTVNIAGSFVIGVMWIMLAARSGAQQLLITGVLGGFTTFSAFSLDTMRLVQDGRGVQAGAYVVVSVVFSIIACGFGLWLAKGMTA